MAKSNFQYQKFQKEQAKKKKKEEKLKRKLARKNEILEADNDLSEQDEGEGQALPEGN